MIVAKAITLPYEPSGLLGTSDLFVRLEFRVILIQPPKVYFITRVAKFRIVV